MSGVALSHLTEDGSKPCALANTGNSLREALNGWPRMVLAARSPGLRIGPSLRTITALGFRSYWMATALSAAAGLAALNSSMAARSAEAQS
ncbi:hypothetical protein D3C81_1744760 [compost metagenome]